MQLARVVNGVFNPTTGIYTATFSHGNTSMQWRLRRVSIALAPTAPGASAQLFQNGQLIDGTALGSFGALVGSGTDILLASDVLVCQWTGAPANTTATMTIYYEEEVITGNPGGRDSGVQGSGLHFSVPAFLTLTIPTGATTGHRIVLDGTTGAILVYNDANQLIESIAPNNGADSQGNSFLTGYTVYNRVTHTYVYVNAGQIFLGSGNVPSTTLAASILGGSASLTITSGQNIGAGQDQAYIVLNGGLQGQPLSGGVPFIRFQDALGLSPVLVGVQGAIIQESLAGVGATWQTPTFNAGFTSNFSQYRLDGFDNVVWDLNFNQTTGVAGSGGAVAIAAVPVGFRPLQTRMVAAAWESSTSVAKGSVVLTFNTNGTVSVLWPSGTANGDKFATVVSIPLGNIL